MNEDIAAMDYETAMAALQQAVDQLGHEQDDLAGAVRAYERGLLLARRCNQLLKDAEYRLGLVETSPSPAPPRGGGESRSLVPPDGGAGRGGGGESPPGSP